MEDIEIMRINSMIHDWMGNGRMNPPFEDQWEGKLKAYYLKYHSEWEWAIKALEKIRKESVVIIEFSVNECDVKIFPNGRNNAYIGECDKESLKAIWISIYRYINHKLKTRIYE